MRRMNSCLLAVILLGGLAMGLNSAAAELKLSLPLGRKAYQTNEQIDLAVVRADTRALAAGTLTLTLAGTDGSALSFDFPVAAVPVTGNDARATEHLHLNGWLLRPGHYTRHRRRPDGATAAR